MKPTQFSSSTNPKRTQQNQHTGNSSKPFLYPPLRGGTSPPNWGAGTSPYFFILRQLYGRIITEANGVTHGG